MAPTASMIADETKWQRSIGAISSGSCLINAKNPAWASTLLFLQDELPQGAVASSRVSIIAIALLNEA